MTLHYHGLPLTPEIMLLDLGGRNVCISFATQRPKQVAISLKIMQSIMFDNGAFSAHTQGVPLDVPGFYAWIAPMLGHPNWAVVPDVIDGTVDDQLALLATWPFPKEFAAPVWHLDKPLDFLLHLVRRWPRVCLGSAGAYWQVGGPKWRQRMQEVFAFLRAELGYIPNLHGLRMLAQVGKEWPLGSADSVNTALNYARNGEMPGVMASRIDRVNGPLSPLKFDPEIAEMLS